MLALSIALGLLAAALAVWIIQGERRHTKTRSRLRQAEQRDRETLIITRAWGSALIMDRLRAAQPPPGAPAALFKAVEGEDLVLFLLFSPPDAPLRTSGFYIECGAFDGVRRSVTHIFDACGWDGLLIEPLPHLADACRRSRPRARVVHAALGPPGSAESVDFLHVPDDESGSQAPEFSSRPLPRDKNRRGGMNIIRVPCMTMDQVLADHTGPIDLLVLDVESAELAVLQGFDLERRQPAVLLIEDNTLGADTRLLEYVCARGYEHAAWLSNNRLFIHGAQKVLLERRIAMQLSHHRHRTSRDGLA